MPDERGQLFARNTLMGATQPLFTGIQVATPGLGLGWTKVADALGEVMSLPEVGRIWIFPPMRRDGREWGTAVVTTTAEHKRFVIFTAKYMLNTRGRRRGQGRVEIDEVGEGPVDVVPEVVRGVQDRVAEGEQAIEISPEIWFTREHDEPPTEA